jgi:hypothetical protein
MSMNFTFEEALPEQLLVDAGRLFSAAAAVLLQAINSLKEGDLSATKEVVEAVRDMKLGLALIQHERSNLEKLGRKIAGAVGTGTLNLHDARDEIGRRLACLRDT